MIFENENYENFELSTGNWNNYPISVGCNCDLWGILWVGMSR